MKPLQLARAIATETVLLPVQFFAVLVTLLPVMVVGALVYPIRHSWTDAIFRTFTTANDEFSRFRLRMAGDPRTAFSNLKKPRSN
jgi:hypothetical protein